MKYTVAFLLMLCSHVMLGAALRADTGVVNLLLNEDVLDNKALLPAAAGYKTFQVQENDTTQYQLQLALDKAGRPLYYFRNIFTPVCYTGECKPVFVNFYWDLLGNYIRYDLPAKEVLTKMDHKVFKQADYEKLHDILAKPNSLLAELKITDLIVPGTENLADSVDARTGATLKTIKNEVISGAVYTCYTLWHIVHGPVTNEMDRITETYNSKQLLHRFLSSRNHDYQYWALDKVMDTKGKIMPGFETDIRQLIAGKNIFMARYALQKADPVLFTGKAAQQWIWEAYTAAPYPLQTAILHKLKNVPLSTALLQKISEVINAGNEEQFRLMLALLQTAETLPRGTLEQLADHLNDAPEEHAAGIYQLLQQRLPANNYVNRKMHEYENSRNQTNK